MKTISIYYSSYFQTSTMFHLRINSRARVLLIVCCLLQQYPLQKLDHVMFLKEEAFMSKKVSVYAELGQGKQQVMIMTQPILSCPSQHFHYVNAPFCIFSPFFSKVHCQKSVCYLLVSFIQCDSYDRYRKDHRLHFSSQLVAITFQVFTLTLSLKVVAL